MIFPLSSMLDPLNIKAQPLPAWPHSRIGSRSTAERQDGRNQELEPWKFIQQKGWGVSPVWKVNQSIQKAQWLWEVDNQSCCDKQWAERADREYSVGPGQRPEQKTETRDVLSGNKVLLIRLGFITRTPLPWSQADGDNWENKKPGTPT